MTRDTRSSRVPDRGRPRYLWFSGAAFRLSWGLGETLSLLSKQRISAVANARHKRDTDARRFTLKHPFAMMSRPSRAVLVAAPVAAVATAAAVTAGVAFGGGGSKPTAAADISQVAKEPTATASAPPSPAPWSSA